MRKFIRVALVVIVFCIVGLGSAVGYSAELDAFQVILPLTGAMFWGCVAAGILAWVIGLVDDLT